MPRLTTLLLASTLALPSFVMPAIAGAQTTQPAAATARDYSIVAPELKAAKAELATYIKLPAGLSTLRDPAVREKIAKDAPPIIRKVATLDAEAAIARAEFAKNSGVMMMGTPALAFDGTARDIALLALNDPRAVADNKAAADGTDAVAARDAKGLQAATEYLTTPDEAAQVAAIDKLTPLYAAAEGKDEKLDTMLAVVMMSKGAAPVAEQHFTQMLSTATPGKFVGTILRQRSGTALQHAAVGKPAVFAGTTPDGKPFSTESLKGKVILIDFWASWCGPCKAELPRVKELYAKYHAQGFEVLGISNDYAADNLTGYLESNPLPWPSLFDEKAADAHKWHPLTQKYGISGIPVMFLIDRSGVIRSVTARSQMETLIPQLLTEQASAAGN